MARFFGLGLWLLLGVSACAGVTRVTALVDHPARMPLEAFPRVVIAPGVGAHDHGVAEALSLHLLGRGVPEVHIELHEALRRLGPQPPGTALVQVSVALEASGRTDWVTRPETVCGAFGCYTAHRTHPLYVPVVEARLALEVRDGSTGRRLQELSFRAQSSGATQAYMERSILRDLEEQLRVAVTGRQERVRVALLDVGHPTVTRALAALRAGRWTEGREILEGFFASGEAAALDPARRARAHYDLAMARRFDPSTVADPERHFAAARSALARAVELDPSPRYAEAAAELERHYDEALMVREQALAREHNHRLATGAGEAVEAPSGVDPHAPIRTPASYGR